jgi:glucose dehydrogenase
MVWDAADFLVAGVLLLVAGFAYELIAARIENKRRGAVFVFALLILFALVWADLAVGVFNIRGFSGD